MEDIFELTQDLNAPAHICVSMSRLRKVFSKFILQSTSWNFITLWWIKSNIEFKTANLVINQQDAFFFKNVDKFSTLFALKIPLLFFLPKERVGNQAS